MTRSLFNVAALLILSLFAFELSFGAITGSRTLIPGKYNMQWSLDEVNQAIEFTLEVNSYRNWVGIGITNNRQTLMSDASLMVATFSVTNTSESDPPQIRCFKGITNKNTRPAEVTPCYASLVSYSADEAAQKTIVKITRKLSVDAGTEAFNKAIQDAPTFVVAAFGKTPNFTFHYDQHASVALNFWDPTVQLLPFNQPNIVYGQYSPSSTYNVNWWTDVFASDKIYFQISASTTGWLGLALAPATTSMQGAAISACVAVDGQRKMQSWYAEVNAKTPGKGPYNYAEFLGSHYNSITKQTSCTFSRPLVTSDAQFDRAVTNGTLNLLWAFSKDNTATLNYHDSNRGGYQLNLLNPGAQDPGSSVLPTVLLWLHGSFMSFSWAVCASVGIFIARFSKKNMPLWWMRFHIGIFVISLFCTIAGFVFILARQNWQINPNNPHTIIGFIVLIGSFIQPIIGIIADRLFNPQRKSPPVFPDQLHWIVGRVLWVIGLLNVYLGLEMVNAHVTLRVLYFVWVAFLIAIFVFNHKPNDAGHALAYMEHEEEKKRLL